jgi:Do/DeqQ family serine protease
LNKGVLRSMALFIAAVFILAALSSCKPSRPKAPPELDSKKPEKTEKSAPAAGPESTSNAENIFIKVAESVTPSVVNISTYNSGEDNDNNGELGRMPKDQYHQGPRGPYSDKSVGSGVIISSDGYIITNAHVVLDATDITVKLSDKREFPGELIGVDAKTDIAVLKIESNETLHPATLGESSNLKIGQWAIAIGNPFGLDRTVTVGVVSGIGREDVGVAQYENFIQTDASINPGNSGGPLLNSSGEVIGINTAIMSAGQGISFAIPIDMVKDISKKLIEKGEVIRGWLGVGIQTLTPELAEGLGIPDKTGVLVNKVYTGSPSEKAGIAVGDVIVQFDGLDIDDARKLQSIVAATEVGKLVEIRVIRAGKEKKFVARIGEMDEFEQKFKEPKTELESSPELGLTIHPVNAATGISGVVVVEVDAGSNAEKAGVTVGDIITTINLKTIKGLKDFKTEVKGLKKGDAVILLLTRANSPLFIAYRVQ